MKKRISLLLVLCMLVSVFAGCMTGLAAEIPEVKQVDSYDDVPAGHWSYPWVSYMTEHGYIHGYPAAENDGLYLYKPDQNITRGEFVTILYFMLRRQDKGVMNFTDIDTKHWSYPYVEVAVGSGYLSGDGAGKIRPDDYITREEASSVVYRAFKLDKYKEETDFADKNEISKWAYEAVMSLADVGVIVGYTGEDENVSYVNPKVNIKRAEIAALLANADKLYPSEIVFGGRTVEYATATGGKVNIDAMFAKNTSDNLSVAIEVSPEKNYTVTYTKDGVEKTVTSDAFAAESFTAAELENLNLKLNFPDAKNGDKVQIKISVTDNDNENVVGEKTYDAEFVSGGTTTPSIIQGGGGTRIFTVKYIVNGVEQTEQVASGSKPTNVPRPSDTTKDYVWTDENGAPIIPNDKIITSDCTFTTDTSTKNRDRVVESLRAYQAMKNKGANTATVNALTADLVDSSITTNATDGTKWWTNDMLQVIVTNDRGFYENDTTKGKDDIVVSKTLKPIYDDVARYIVDRYSYFADATVTSANKSEFVSYYRAMVKTIDAAADAAVDAYVTARKNNADTAPNNNRYKDEAFEAFLTAATSTGASSLSNALDTEYPAVTAERKQSLSIFAQAYVSDMVKNMAPSGTAENLRLNAGLAEIKTVLETIYPSDFDFTNGTAMTTAAEQVKTEIAARGIYAK